MITIDGKWVMEGMDRKDPRRIKSSLELMDYINEIGWLLLRGVTNLFPPPPLIGFTILLTPLNPFS